MKGPRGQARGPTANRLFRESIHFVLTGRTVALVTHLVLITSPIRKLRFRQYLSILKQTSIGYDHCSLT